MPAGKTVSVTAPASFWYLQYFLIQALSLIVDYLVYMTYDLRG
jgi:chitinase